jgi:hypothetical protein
MNNSKILNSTCICKNRLHTVNSEVIMIEPCEHLIHIKCVENLIKCPYCKTKINGFTKKNDYKNNKFLTQKCIDIMSMSFYQNKANLNLKNILCNTPFLTYILSHLASAKSKQDLHQACKNVLSLAGITLKIKGLKKTYNNDNKIFIANHFGILDGIIMYYILGCGFVTSMPKNNIMQHIANILEIIFIKRGRGKYQNTVLQIKEFIKKHKSICIFPEGMIPCTGSIIRFRSGVFNVGEPIYPVVLKCKKKIYCDINITEVLKIASTLEETIEVIFLDPVYPPFNKNTPEIIRTSIAKHGNLLMSRVLANDFVDP